MINENKKEIMDCHVACAPRNDEEDKAPLVKGRKRRGDYYSELTDNENPTTAKAVLLPLTREDRMT